jgi:hypothetical protein
MDREHPEVTGHADRVVTITPAGRYVTFQALLNTGLHTIRLLKKHAVD